MPLTKKQKQIRARIAHAQTFWHLDSAAESSWNSTPAGTSTPSLGTEDLAHLTPPASHESDLNDGGIFLDVIEEESEQLLEDYGGNSLPGTIEAVTSQSMFSDAQHKQPKGIKLVLTECGLWPKKSLHLECKPKCASGSGPADCCARNLLQSQPDFQEQKSRVQEIIEEAGHLCIFLPKYHCELNFIEYFWAAIKRYLREHCDYTFSTLKENMPKALASVDVQLIQK